MSASGRSYPLEAPCHSSKNPERSNPARATTLLRALLVLTRLETSR